jgi:carbamate kinase
VAIGSQREITWSGRPAIRFVEATGNRAAIGGLGEIEAIVAGDAGTEVVAR